MKSKSKYTDEPMGMLNGRSDFLPPPDQLVLKEDNVKVTLALKKSSIAFLLAIIGTTTIPIVVLSA